MRFLSFSFLCFFFSVSMAQINMPAISYYQMIKTEQKKIGREIYFFKQSVSELNLKLLNFQIDNSIAVVDSTPAFNNETEFKKATLDLFRYFKSVGENQYKTLLQYVEDPELDNKDYREKLQALFKDISTKERPYDDQFNTAEDNYTKKYGIKLE